MQLGLATVHKLPAILGSKKAANFACLCYNMFLYLKQENSQNDLNMPTTEVKQGIIGDSVRLVMVL